MRPSDDELLEILRRQGFVMPDRWLSIARDKRFQPVDSVRLTRCLDCDAALGPALGHYVYYSTLMHLRECSECGLVHTDARLADHVVRDHFEQAYKDEEYFGRRRRAIFRQLAQVIDEHAPRGGSVLDVGGAKGHMLAVLRDRRPDLRLVVADRSATACVHAREVYGFDALKSTIGELAALTERFDVVVLSDVLYYEDDLARAWPTLAGLLQPKGSLVLRFPNKLGLMRAFQRLGAITGRATMQTSMPFLNPEHIHVFSRSYLARRLRRLGFSSVEFMPAAMLEPSLAHRVVATAWHAVARAVHRVTGGRVLPTSAMLVVARL